MSYEHRPSTCRAYDCRVFAAAGIDADRTAISRRARRWEFSHATEDDRIEHAAVRTAARFLRAHAECFPDRAVPGNPAHVAILAIKVHDVFLEDGDQPGASARESPARDLGAAVAKAAEEFEARRSG